MSDPFLGQITMVGFNFAPNGWAFCNGQLLPIAQNQALFSLLGTTYGGDGQVTFALPNLQSRAPASFGGGANGAPTLALGAALGVETVALTTSETRHTHALMGNSAEGSAEQPAGNQLATGAVEAYVAAGNSVLMHQDMVVPAAGGGVAHNNVQPSLTLNFIIALVGIFPSQN